MLVCMHHRMFFFRLAQCSLLNSCRRPLGLLHLPQGLLWRRRLCSAGHEHTRSAEWCWSFDVASPMLVHTNQRMFDIRLAPCSVSNAISRKQPQSLPTKCLSPLITSTHGVAGRWCNQRLKYFRHPLKLRIHKLLREGIVTMVNNHWLSMVIRSSYLLH